MNNDVRVSVSAIFLRGHRTNLNQKIVETHEALKKYCACHGMDFISHSNIAFKHLAYDKLHLNPNGARLFARNLIRHANSW